MHQMSGLAQTALCLVHGVQSSKFLSYIINVLANHSNPSLLVNNVEMVVKGRVPAT